MNPLISPSLPQLQQPVQRLQASLQTVANQLDRYPAFTSISMHMVDKHHVDSADTVALVNAARTQKQLAFTNQNIVGHRVDLSSTYLGTIFKTRQSGVHDSRMHAAHVVYGSYCEPAVDVPVAFECVFDATVGKEIPTAKELESLIAPVKNVARRTVQQLQSVMALHHSLGDALRLHEPTTPNAYVLKWDVVHSTTAAFTQYPLLREYIQAWSVAATRIVQKYAGKVVAQTGDGQNIVFMLPATINRADTSSVQQYGKAHIVPALQELEQTARVLHGYFGYETRIAVGLGYVEKTPLGEHTGKIFFELSSLLKQHTANDFLMSTPSAAHVTRLL